MMKGRTIESNATSDLPKTSQETANRENGRCDEVDGRHHAAAAASVQQEQQGDGMHIPANTGLISNRRKSIRERANPQTQREWQRPYWLGGALFLILFAFWILDSLKDPIFGQLVDGNLESHQPPAKLVSVATTLMLVCLIEYVSNRRQRQQLVMQQSRSSQEILDPGGRWSNMAMSTEAKDPHEPHVPDDAVSISMFFYIGIPYIFLFVIFANLLSQYDRVKDSILPGFDGWYVLAYVFYASIESFGSLAVASFWSYTNSTLSLSDAERYYGPIIAVAQLGAIGGATMVASNQWSPMRLLILSCLMVVMLLVLIYTYNRKFPPTSYLAVSNSYRHNNRIRTWQDDNVTMTQPFWSGILLILRHNYVLLLLGVSCLYEVSLTCLDYQMKLLGWSKFEHISAPIDSGMSFSQFMGHYGQVVNGTSLIVSSFIFPLLLKRVGLRITLRLFPTLLFVATVVAYLALPGNLTVLFLSLSLLKAMTYSLHDPAKELLYLPTSNAIKFRSKFWIDVVGARLSKAFGSAINTYAGSVDRSVQIGSWPALITAAGLFWASYKIGKDFDSLIESGEIVGLEADLNEERETYASLSPSDQEWSRLSSGEIEFASQRPLFHRDTSSLSEPGDYEPENESSPFVSDGVSEVELTL